MNQEKLQQAAKSLHIEHSKRHVFLCVGETCCSASEGEASWKLLKDVLKQRNLSLSDDPASCYRTKVGCLRICMEGPILVVYPEGHWYSGMTAERIPEFVERQIVGGEPIPEWIFATNPLR